MLVEDATNIGKDPRHGLTRFDVLTLTRSAYPFLRSQICTRRRGDLNRGSTIGTSEGCERTISTGCILITDAGGHGRGEQIVVTYSSFPSHST